MRTITVASETTWQASAWWLERRRPNDWGRKERVEHSGKVESEVQFPDNATYEEALKTLEDLTGRREDVPASG